MAYERRSYSGNAPATTTTSNVDNAVTTLPVASTAGWPTITAPSVGFIIVVDGGTATEESMLVTAFVANTSATVTRGYDGPTAQAHTAPAAVQLCHSAKGSDEANQLVHALLTSGTTGQVATVDTTLTPPIKLAANPAGIPLSTVTTAGDIIAATASATVERLGKGSAGQVLTVGGADASGLQWATPATQGLLALHRYAPGTTDNKTTSSNVYVAVDTVNDTVSFVAPASGQVLVRVQASVAVDVAAHLITVALFTHGTTTVVGDTVSATLDSGNSRQMTFEFVVSGLTGGTTYQYDLAYGAGTSGGTASVIAKGGTAFDNNGPTIMTVWAA